LPVSAKWADFSPNCQYLLVGFENPFIEVMHNATLYRWDGSMPVREFRLKGYMKDFAWSANSRFLFVLETEERYSKSLSGLFGFFIGHPIPLETLFAAIIDTSSGQIRRKRIAEAIPYGTAVFSSSSARCQ
jgi:hypothetical protein